MIRARISGEVLCALLIVCGISLCGCASEEEADERQSPEQRVETRADAAQAEEAGPGVELYLAYCAACHRDDGSGIGSIYPPLDGSDFLADRERTIDAILNGLSGPITIDGKEYNGTMPPLPPMYDDERAAAVINYVVDRFGGGSWQTTAEEVAAIRD